VPNRNVSRFPTVLLKEENWGNFGVFSGVGGVGGVGGALLFKNI